jgi:hypothetical protein
MLVQLVERFAAAAGWLAAATGCAECYRVTGTLDEALLGSHVGIWLAMHPQEPLGLLLQAHMKGGQRCAL